MGEALRRVVAARRGWGRAAALFLIHAFALLAVAAGLPLSAGAQLEGRRFDGGRFAVVAFPRDEVLARSLLSAALARDTFPGLPRPRARVLISIAPDERTFREWIGPGVPEWGAAFAFPAANRIVMQGSGASSEAGDPLRVLRHELAHLALHEYLGALPPRWFDEGYASYAAGEWDRDQVIATNLALALRGMPTFTALDSGFAGGAQRADASYALAFRAVAELAAVDQQRGLALFFQYWKTSGELEIALRQAYGMTRLQYEQRWRDRTRARYGGLALFADATLAATVMLLLIGPFYVLRRRRDAERMRALRRAEAEAERREREAAIELLLRSIGPNPSEERAPPDQSV